MERLGYYIAPGVQWLLAACSCFWGLDDEPGNWHYDDYKPDRHLSGRRWKRSRPTGMLGYGHTVHTVHCVGMWHPPQAGPRSLLG